MTYPLNGEQSGAKLALIEDGDFLKLKLLDGDTNRIIKVFLTLENGRHDIEAIVTTLISAIKLYSPYTIDGLELDAAENYKLHPKLARLPEKLTYRLNNPANQESSSIRVGKIEIPADGDVFIGGDFWGGDKIVNGGDTIIYNGPNDLDLPVMVGKNNVQIINKSSK